MISAPSITLAEPCLALFAAREITYAMVSSRFSLVCLFRVCRWPFVVIRARNTAARPHERACERDLPLRLLLLLLLHSSGLSPAWKIARLDCAIPADFPSAWLRPRQWGASLFSRLRKGAHTQNIEKEFNLWPELMHSPHRKMRVLARH